MSQAPEQPGADPIPAASGEVLSDEDLDKVDGGGMGAPFSKSGGADPLNPRDAGGTPDSDSNSKKISGTFS